MPAQLVPTSRHWPSGGAAAQSGCERRLHPRRNFRADPAGEALDGVLLFLGTCMQSWFLFFSPPAGPIRSVVDVKRAEATLIERTAGASCPKARFVSLKFIAAEQAGVCDLAGTH